MPPPNDALANAIWLNSTGLDSGHADGTNAGATVQVGEPGQKTVWYKMFLPEAGSQKWRIWTHSAVAFNTSLKVYYCSTAPPTVPTIGTLLFIAGNDDYAHWDIGSEVVFATGEFLGSWFYIQVSGVGTNDEGAFRLSYNRFYPINLGGCNDCGLEPTTYQQCVQRVTIDPLVGATYSLGVRRGVFKVRFCGGAWRYNMSRPDLPQYVTTRIPVNTAQDWPDQETPGYFVHVITGDGASKRVYHFAESPTVQFGYPTEKEAVDAVRCKYILLKLYNQEIRVKFTDKLYSDNEHAAHDMKIALYTYGQPYTVIGTIMFLTSGSTYDMRFLIRNNTELDSDYLHVTLRPNANITNPLVNGPMPLLIPAGGAVWANFTFDMVPLGKTDAQAVLGLTEDAGGDSIIWDDLHVDLTPVLSLHLENVAPNEGCGPNARGIVFSIRNVGFGATYALVAAITNPVGCVLLSDSSCDTVTPPHAYPQGEIPPFSVKRYVTTYIRSTGGGACSFDVTLTDGTFTHPPARIQFSI